MYLWKLINRYPLLSKPTLLITNCKHIYRLTTYFSTSNANQVGVLRAGTTVSCTKFTWSVVSMQLSKNWHCHLEQLQRIGMCLWKMQKASCEKVECLVSQRSGKHNYTFCCSFSYICDHKTSPDHCILDVVMHVASHFTVLMRLFLSKSSDEICMHGFFS